jgi:hypothetical protein
MVDKIIQHESKRKPFLCERIVTNLNLTGKNTVEKKQALLLENGHKRASIASIFVLIQMMPVEQLVVVSIPKRAENKKKENVQSKFKPNAHRTVNENGAVGCPNSPPVAPVVAPPEKREPAPAPGVEPNKPPVVLVAVGVTVLPRGDFVANAPNEKGVVAAPAVGVAGLPAVAPKLNAGFAAGVVNAIEGK